MQTPRSSRSHEARIFDTWIDDPGPYIDLTPDAPRHEPVSGTADRFTPSGAGDTSSVLLHGDPSPRLLL
jgi:hypothetical protein